MGKMISIFITITADNITAFDSYCNLIARHGWMPNYSPLINETEKGQKYYQQWMKVVAEDKYEAELKLAESIKE